MDDALVRAGLHERYGTPVRVSTAGLLRGLGLRGQIHSRDALAFRHDDEAAALAYVEANRNVYGHTVLGPYPTEVGHVYLVDLRPAKFRLDVAWTDPEEPD